MTENKNTVNITLDQMCVLAAFERVMRATEFEVGLLRNISKTDAAEKLDATFRHLTKHRDEYLRSCQTGLIIAPSGAIPDIKLTH